MVNLSGAEKQKELEERKEKIQSYHSQIIQEKSSKKALFILEIILSLVLMGLGIWLASYSVTLKMSWGTFLKIVISWIGVLVLSIGAIVLLYFSIKFYKEFCKKFEGASKNIFNDKMNPQIKEIVPAGTKKIKASQFEDCNNIFEVVIPEGVKTIEKFAFKGCKNLVSITLPSSLKSIGELAFMGCDKLVEIFNYSTLDIINDDNFPENHGAIAQNAVVIHTKSEPSIIKHFDDYIYMCHQGKYKLLHYKDEQTNLVLPNNIEGKSYEIYDYAFYDKSNLLQVIIPSGVDSIGRWAFGYCRCLEKVIISEGIKKIEYLAFSNCESLQSISIPNSLVSIGSGTLNGCFSSRLFNIYKNNFYVGNESNPYLCLVSDVRSEKLDVHPQTKFIACDSYGIKEIHLPISVKFIARNCFSGNIPTIYYEGTKEDLNQICVDWQYGDILKKAKVYLKDNSVTYFK